MIREGSVRKRSQQTNPSLVKTTDKLVGEAMNHRYLTPGIGALRLRREILKSPCEIR